MFDLIYTECGVSIECQFCCLVQFNLLYVNKIFGAETMMIH